MAYTSFFSARPTRLGASGAVTIAIYALFDRALALPWPQALIGDLLPALRAASGLV